jgi:hypothetical protein
MTEFTTSLDKITHPALSELASYWQQLAPTPVVPHRQQFNPIDVPQCLQNIILFDVLPGRPRYFIRLAGSAVNPVYQRSIAGEYLEGLLNEEEHRKIIAQYDYSVDHQVPTYMAGSINSLNGKKLQYERVILPLTSNNQTTDKLLVGLHFFDVRPHLIDRPIFKLGT